MALSPVVPLEPAHRLQAFECGDLEIDEFLQHRAAGEQTLRLSQVYVTAGDSQQVLGYFTLSPIAVRVDASLLERLAVGGVPYPQIGGFLLGCLGVDKSIQRRGIGEALVMRAAQIAKAEAAVVGGAFLAVDPKTDSLMQWYAKQDFRSLGGKTRRMVLPLRAVP